MSKKTKFARECMKCAADLIGARERFTILRKIWNAQGYATGQGQSSIGDADVLELDITVTQLNAFMTSLYNKFNDLMNNSAVSGTVDGDGICNAMRSDYNC